MKGSKWNKPAAYSKLPGLADWAMVVPDDMFMTNDWRTDLAWDRNKKQQLFMQAGSYRLGWCDTESGLGSGHGPFIMNKCAYQKVIEHYHAKIKGMFDATIKKGGLADTGLPMVDVECLYKQASSRSHAYMPHPMPDC